MKIEIREQKILSLLESRGEMSAVDLSNILGISVSTLRKQLALMQEKKLVIRTYGGVMSVNQHADESFESKIHKAVIEKRRIANKARTLIGNDQSISLGSGTTVYALCNILDDLQGVSIYTNSMQSAEYLALCGSLDVHISGGIIRAATGTIIGNEAYEFFRGIEVDSAYISCDALDENGNVYSDSVTVATVEREVLKSAKKRYVLCDSTKLGKKSVAKIANIAECDGVITGSSESDVVSKLSYIGNVIFS